MPVRGSTKNFDSAVKKPFAKRFGLLSNPSFIDGDMDNNGAGLTFANAAGTASLPGLNMGADDVLRVGGSAYRYAPKPIKFIMNANAGIVTQAFFIADQAYEVVGFSEIHSVAGNDAAAVTLDITRETGTQAPGAGVSLLPSGSTFNLKGTANTLQTYGQSTNQDRISLAAGDRLSIVVTGVTTTLAGLAVEVFVIPGYTGDLAVFNMAANAGLVDQCFYTANKNVQISAIYYIHSALGTNASAVNLQVTKDVSTNAPGAGTDLLTNNTNAGFNCKAAINTVQTGALSATAANLRLVPGDRLSVDFAGTLTALAGVIVVVVFTPVYRTFDYSWNLSANADQGDQIIFIASRPVKILYVREVHSVAAGAVVTMQLKLQRGTDAKTAGSSLLSNNTAAGFDMDGTANTVQVGTFVDEGLLTLYAGDRLSYDITGTVTNLAGVQSTITFQEA